MPERARVNHVTTTISKSVDQYKHINYKNFPALFELGQDSYLAECKLSFDLLETRDEIRSVVVSYKVDIKSSILKGDTVNIATSLRLGVTSLTFEQNIKKDKVLVATQEIVVVLVEANDMTQKVAISSDLRVALR